MTSYVWYFLCMRSCGWTVYLIFTLLSFCSFLYYLSTSAKKNINKKAQDPVAVVVLSPVALLWFSSLGFPTNSQWNQVTTLVISCMQTFNTTCERFWRLTSSNPASSSWVQKLTCKYIWCSDSLDVCLFECMWVAAHVAEVHWLKCYVLRRAVRVVTSLAADAFMYNNSEVRLSRAVVTGVSTFVCVAWVCDTWSRRTLFGLSFTFIFHFLSLPWHPG